MKKYNIKNIDDLKAKRFELRDLSTQQFAHLQKEVSTFAHKFTVKGFLGDHINKNTITEFDNKIGLTKKISSIILPMFLNRTLFKNSGFLSKILVNITGSKIGSNLDLENITALGSIVKDYLIEFISGTKNNTSHNKGTKNSTTSRSLFQNTLDSKDEVLGI